MSNIKPEALSQECSKRKVFLKIPQKSLENDCSGAFFTIKVQIEPIKPNVYVHFIPGRGIF